MSPIEAASPTLARTITQLRRRRSLTQEDVAIAAGITPGTLSRIEGAKANPTWTTVQRIAAALSVSMTELARAAEGEG